MALKKAVGVLQHVSRSVTSDPEVMPLMDAVATTLKVGKNEIPVNSDEEALRSYLSASFTAPPVSPVYELLIMFIICISSQLS